jgi:hypothetical protein
MVSVVPTGGVVAPAGVVPTGGWTRPLGTRDAPEDGRVATAELDVLTGVGAGVDVGSGDGGLGRSERVDGSTRAETEGSTKPVPASGPGTRQLRGVTKASVASTPMPTATASVDRLPRCFETTPGTSTTIADVVSTS